MSANPLVPQDDHLDDWQSELAERDRKDEQGSTCPGCPAPELRVRLAELDPGGATTNSDPNGW